MNIGRPDALQCDGLRAAVCSFEQIKQEETDTNQRTWRTKLNTPAFITE